MTERHPLSDALNDAEHSPQAQAYEVPVELIRSRARRRRHARTGATAGALALVVAGAALVVPNLSDDRTPVTEASPRPANALCGATSADLAHDDRGVGRPDAPESEWTDDAIERMSVENMVLPASVTPSRDGTWSVTSQIDAIPGPTIDIFGPIRGWTYATTVALLQDDRVVALLDTPAASERAEDGATTPSAAPGSYPLSTRTDARVIPCTGEALRPGSYQVIASTTAAIGTVEDHAVVRATSAPITVQLPADGSAPDPLGCGASDDQLRYLAGNGTVRGPLVINAPSAPRLLAVGDSATFDVQVTNYQEQLISATSGLPRLVVTRGGTIVGGSSEKSTGGIEVDLPYDETATFDAEAPMATCTPDGTSGSSLPAGQYEVWAVMSFAPTAGDDGQQSGWQAAGGPWPLTIVGDPVANAAPAPPKCGESTAWLVEQAQATAAGDVRLTTPLVAGMDPEVVIANGLGEDIEVTSVSLVPSYGGTVIGGWTVHMTIGPELVRVAPGEIAMLQPPSQYGSLGFCERDAWKTDYEVWVVIDVTSPGSPQERALVLGPLTDDSEPGLDCTTCDQALYELVWATQGRGVQFTRDGTSDVPVVKARNTRAWGVNVDMNRARAVLTRDGAVLGTTAVAPRRAAWRNLGPGREIEVMTLDPAQLASDLGVTTGPAEAWVMVPTNSGTVLSEPVMVDLP